MANEERPLEPGDQPIDDAVSRVGADVPVPANATVAANVLAGASVKLESDLTVDQEQ
jgi:hypothetical protein